MKYGGLRGGPWIFLSRQCCVLTGEFHMNPDWQTFCVISLENTKFAAKCNAHKVRHEFTLANFTEFANWAANTFAIINVIIGSNPPLPYQHHLPPPFLDFIFDTDKAQINRVHSSLILSVVLWSRAFLNWA
jgi:hypothetical protein